MTENIGKIVGWQAQRGKNFAQPEEVLRQDFSSVPMSVIKESAQNSIDASVALDDDAKATKTLYDYSSSETVVMKFQVLKVTGKAKEKYLKEIRFEESLSKYLKLLIATLSSSPQAGGKRDAEVIKNLLKEINDGNKPIYLLNITDFDTTGLLGPEEADDDDEFKNFWSLMHCLYGTPKTAGGGSWNLGKTSFTHMSRLKMFIASSNLSVPVDTEDGEKSINRLYGIALQQVAKLKNEDRNTAVGTPWTFGTHPETSQEFPVEDQNESIWDDDGEITKNLLINVLNKKETGTTIQIPFIRNLDEEYLPETNSENQEIDIKLYAETILRECYKWLWPAINSNKLRIEVEYAEINNSDLSNTIFSKVDHSTEIKSESQEYVDLFESFNNSSQASNFENENLDEDNKQLVITRPLFRIDNPKGVKKSKKEHKPHLLLKSNDITPEDNEGFRTKNKVALIRAAGIVVKYEDFSIPRSDISFSGVLLSGNSVESSPENQLAERFLRACEDAAHKEWWGERNQLKNYYDVSVADSEFSNSRNTSLRIKRYIRTPIQDKINEIYKVNYSSEGEEDYHAAKQFILDLPGPEAEPKPKVFYASLSNDDEHKCTVKVMPNTNIRFRTNNVNVYKDPKIRGSKIKILSLRKGDKLKSYTTIVDQNFFEKVKSCIEIDSSYLKNNLEIVKKYNLKIGDYFDEVYKTKLQIGDILFSNQTNEELSFEVVYKLDNKTVSGFECNWDTVQLLWEFNASRITENGEISYSNFFDVELEEE